MQRLPLVDPSRATGETLEALRLAETRLGGTPNVVRTMANSAVALSGYLQLDATLSEGRLDPILRAEIALVVAEANDCRYCVAAQTAAGKLLGMDEDHIQAARQASSRDPKVAAALQFARTVVEYRADITDQEFDRVRKAGYTNSELAEILANIVLNIYANYFNSIAQTEVDVGGKRRVDSTPT